MVIEFKARMVNNTILYYHLNPNDYRTIVNLPIDFELNPIVGSFIGLVKFDLEYLGHTCLIHNPHNIDESILSRDLEFNHTGKILDDYIGRRFNNLNVISEGD